MNDVQESPVNMEFENLTRDAKIPVLGLGTWNIGGGAIRDTSRDREHIQFLRTAIELGVTHFDTAEMYGRGHSEEIVGEAIKSFPREKLFITTKVSPEHLHYAEVLAAARRSLQRLDTQYIDLYLVHVPNLQIPIQETMKAFDFLHRDGLIKFVGVSNFTVEQLQEAQEYTRNRIVTNQIEYSLLTRNRGNEYMTDVESSMMPYCQENDIVVTAYRPLARGRLTRPGFRILDYLAKKYNKTRAQTAINWLISKKKVITIPKTSTIEHLKENLGALGWRLERQDISRLDSQFPVQ